MTINIPERNRAIKKLLLATYPGTNLSVKAGNGTARHWVYIEFFRRVGNPPGMTHNRVADAIADLIVGAGIEVSTFPRDDAGRNFGTLPCINITMPHEVRS
jgi:hypothetical protein